MSAMTRKLYLALIGDVAASRRADAGQRAELQEELLGMTAALSRSAPAGAIAARLVLTGGDGVQTLLHAHRATHAVDLIQELTDRLHGFWSAYPGTSFPPILFGVGLGPLSTGELRRGASPAANPGALDGPCFHRARGALELARKERAWVRFQGLGEPEDQALNALFDLMSAVRSGWTTNQGLITHGARKTTTQKMLAEERKVSPSVISEALKAAHFRELLAGEAAARALIEARVQTFESTTAGDRA
jgi:hypothetical protein